MIYKLDFDFKTEYAQAKSQLHLFQSYEAEYEDFQEIKEVTEISEEEAKAIMLKNNDYDTTDATDMEHISLFDTVVGDDFLIVGSTEWE